MNRSNSQPVNTAVQTLLWRRLMLPILATSLVVVSLTAFYGGRFIEAQQLRNSRSIGYTATTFLRHAEQELNALSLIIPAAQNDFVVSAMSINQASHGVFDTLYLLDADGKLLFLAPFDERYVGLDMSRRTYFADIECGTGVYYSIPFTSLRTGQPTSYISRCVDSGEVLVGELNLAALERAISMIRFNDQQVIFVVDQTGTLLAHPDPDLVAQQLNVSNWLVVSVGLKQDDIVHYWRDGRLWIGSTSKIEPTGWVVITEVPFLSIYAPYLGALSAMVLLFLLIFYLALRVFVRQLQVQLIYPLARLSASTDALAVGDYSSLGNSTWELDHFTEINRLVINFQNMKQAILTRESHLKESQEQYRRLVEYSPDAIIVHSNMNIVYANTAATKLYLVDSADALIGQPIVSLVNPDSRISALARLEKLQEGEQVLPLTEQQHVKFDGTTFHAEVLTSSIYFGGDYVAQTIVRDITRRKKEEQFLKHRATHDSLTELPNRFLFQDRLQHALAKSRRSHLYGAVLFVDLDNFKSVNDAFGHQVGDSLLQQVALSFCSSLREGDTVARLGGDEFVLLLEELKNPLDASRVAETILQNFRTPYRVDDREVLISFSMGISIFPDDGNDAQTLLQAADAAMYSAKGDGKHRYKYYSPEMRARSLERITLVSYLNRALERKEFFLQYQPQVNSRTGRMIGVEALLRWSHPELGLTPPDVFIPVAEETGMILPIGQWVLETACAQAAEWQKVASHPITVAINLSNLQLKQANLSTLLCDVLKNTGTSPESVEIELTENVVFQSSNTAAEDLEKIRSVGVKLAMDDFGTGYSTLGHLAHLPFDRIKIDQRLAPNLFDRKDAAIISGTLSICKDLGLDVVAEGVETFEQVSFYQARGCYNFQGWYFSRAVDPEHVTEYLRSNVDWRTQNHKPRMG